MDPQSFIVGLMASITAFGGSILVAMIVLERPRYGLRCWPWRVSNGRLRLRFMRQLFRQRTSQEWLEADDPQARSRQRAVLERMQHRRAKRRRQGVARKHNPANKA
jgi:hypothetical protein